MLLYMWWGRRVYDKVLVLKVPTFLKWKVIDLNMIKLDKSLVISRSALFMLLYSLFYVKAPIITASEGAKIYSMN